MIKQHTFACWPITSVISDTLRFARLCVPSCKHKNKSVVIVGKRCNDAATLALCNTNTTAQQNNTRQTTQQRTPEQTEQQEQHTRFFANLCARFCGLLPPPLRISIMRFSYGAQPTTSRITERMTFTRLLRCCNNSNNKRRSSPVVRR